MQVSILDVVGLTGGFADLGNVCGTEEAPLLAAEPKVIMAGYYG